MPSARSRLGDWGEDIAGRFLEARGFRIRDRKYRCPRGEIDLVATEGKELVFVEVRTRRSNLYGTPAESITPAKAQRLIAACHHYVQHLDFSGDQVTMEAGSAPAPAWRIDLVAVQPVPGKPPLIDHLRNAVEEQSV